MTNLMRVGKLGLLTVAIMASSLTTSCEMRSLDEPVLVSVQSRPVVSHRVWVLPELKGALPKIVAVNILIEGDNHAIEFHDAGDGDWQSDLSDELFAKIFKMNSHALSQRRAQLKIMSMNDQGRYETTTSPIELVQDPSPRHRR